MNVVPAHRGEIGRLCRMHAVKELYVFGSVVREDFAATSDVDFLVEFDWSDERNLSGRFLGLKSGLEALLGRPVDLVCYSAIRNPYFKSAVETEKEMVTLQPWLRAPASGRHALAGNSTRWRSQPREVLNGYKK